MSSALTKPRLELLLQLADEHRFPHESGAERRHDLRYFGPLLLLIERTKDGQGLHLVNARACRRAAAGARGRGPCAVLDLAGAAVRSRRVVDMLQPSQRFWTFGRARPRPALRTRGCGPLEQTWKKTCKTIIDLMLKYLHNTTRYWVNFTWYCEWWGTT